MYLPPVRNEHLILNYKYLKIIGHCWSSSIKIPFLDSEELSIADNMKTFNTTLPFLVQNRLKKRGKGNV